MCKGPGSWWTDLLRGRRCLPSAKEGGQALHHAPACGHYDPTRRMGLDSLTPILWSKISNGATEAEGNGAGFYGKPYQPGAIVKNDFEYILFLRKGGSYRSPTPMQKALSVLSKQEMQQWLRTTWSDVKGESTRKGHPAPYPLELAERLIRLFSFAGDTVLDPFAGTATTSVAAIQCGRNSIANEIEPKYLALAKERLCKAQVAKLFAAQFEVEIEIEGGSR